MECLFPLKSFVIRDWKDSLLPELRPGFRVAGLHIEWPVEYLQRLKSISEI